MAFDWRRIAAIASGAGRGMVAVQERDQRQRQQAFQNMLLQRQLGMQQQGLTSRLDTEAQLRQLRLTQEERDVAAETRIETPEQKYARELEETQADALRAWRSRYPAGLLTGREPTYPVQLGRGIGQPTAPLTGAMLPTGGLAPRVEGADPWQREAAPVIPSMPTVEPQLAGTIPAPTALTPVAGLDRPEMTADWLQREGEITTGESGVPFPGEAPPTPRGLRIEGLKEELLETNLAVAKLDLKRDQETYDTAIKQDIADLEGTWLDNEAKERAATLAGPNVTRILALSEWMEDNPESVTTAMVKELRAEIEGHTEDILQARTNAAWLKQYGLTPQQYAVINQVAATLERLSMEQERIDISGQPRAPAAPKLGATNAEAEKILTQPGITPEDATAAMETIQFNDPAQKQRYIERTKALAGRSSFSILADEAGFGGR